jgi:hypothetical protein
MLHSARSLLIGKRTQLINAARGHLSELGIVAERAMLGFAELAAIVRDESDQRLPATARAALMILVRQIEALNAEIARIDSTLRKENKASELGPRLETIPSVGPVIASAFRARITDAKLFKNGRHQSAWIGLVPENDSTGGKVKQKGLSKKAIAICAHSWSTARWPSCARRRNARISIPGSRSYSAACRPNRRRSPSPTRPRASPGSSWSTVPSTSPATAPPNIERRCAWLPDKRVSDGVIEAAAAHDCNARARGTRRKASRVAEVLMA